MQKVYTDEYCVKVNGAKSVYLVFRSRKCKLDNRKVIFNANKLQTVQYMLYIWTTICMLMIIWYLMLLHHSGEIVTCTIVHGWFWSVAVFCKVQLFWQYCCSYDGAPLCISVASVGFMCIAWCRTLWKIWGYHLLHNATISHCRHIVCQVSLRQNIMTFIHKAIDYKSPVISSVANLSMQNPWYSCGVPLLQHYEYSMYGSDSASDIGCLWQEKVINKWISEVNVLVEIVEIYKRWF